MIRHVTCSADAYIAARVIDGTWTYDGNTGRAGTLDLYKLRGQTSTVSGGVRTPNVELTRALIGFDGDWLAVASSSGQLDTRHGSFYASLLLHDAYGGQPAPENIAIVAYPLGREFREGDGRDIVFLADVDATNWLSASNGVTWYLTGCGLGGYVGTGVDYITQDVNGPLGASVMLQDGTEDAVLDITRSVADWAAGILPYLSYRVSLTASQEEDASSYFVKRFSSRHAFNARRRPAIRVGWDASIWDSSLNPLLDDVNTIFTQFYDNGVPVVAQAYGTQFTGPNCLLMQLSSGSWSASFDASQHVGAEGPALGLYSSSFGISSLDPIIEAHLLTTGSFTADVTWQTTGGAYVRSGGSLTFYRPGDAPSAVLERMIVSYGNLADEYDSDATIHVVLTTFDPGSQHVHVTKKPRVSANVPIRGLHVSVLDAITSARIIEPDVSLKSTLTSLTSVAHTWQIHASALAPGGSYVLQAYAYDGYRLRRVGEPSPPFTIGVQRC